MVPKSESPFKRSLKNLLHIWLLLCLATLLSSLLYVDRVTSQTYLSLEADQYHLLTRQCQVLPGFSAQKTSAPLYYPLWLSAQHISDTLHQRPAHFCQKTPSSPMKGEPGSLRSKN